MPNIGTANIAGEGDHRRIGDSDELRAAEAAEIFCANRERIERILNRERVDIENTERLNYVIFQSILKNILKGLPGYRHNIPSSPMYGLLRDLGELDRYADSGSEYSAKLALDYRFPSGKNLLETLLESGYYDIDDACETYAEQIRTLMIQSGVATPPATASAGMRLMGLSRSFVSYDGGPHGSFQDDVSEFARHIAESRGVNVRLPWGETMFQLLLAHAANPRNADAANRCLDILVHEIAPTENGGTCVDTDLPDPNGLSPERIIEQKFAILRKHPANFPIETLERYRKSAYGWLDYARKVREYVIESHRS